MGTANATASAAHDADPRFLRCVARLVCEDTERRELLAIADNAAYVAMEDTSLAVVIHPRLRGEALLAALREQLDRNPQAHHKLVVIGGLRDMRQILQRCQPGRWSRRMVQVYHLSDAGELWSGRASRLDSAVGRALQASLERSSEPSLTLQALAERVRRPTPDERDASAEHQRFLEAYRAIRPRFTRAAVGLLLAVFGLQLAWSGTDFLPGLVRMGANGAAALGPEPWRLLSSVLLHGGWLHLGANAFMLYVLGSHIEKILGWRRLAMLLVASGLLGSVFSAVRSAALVSVGASGAIWGLLGATMGLALRPRGVVPASVVGRLRHAAFANLVINLAVSFVPGIDLMAHVGGGVAGGVLAYFGVLARGITPLTDPTQAHAPGRTQRLAGVRVGSGVAVVAPLLSLGIAVGVGRPWELVRPVALDRVHVPGTRFSLEVPPGELEFAAPGVFNVGDPLRDAVTVGFAFRPWSHAPDVDAWHARPPALDPEAALQSQGDLEAGEPPSYTQTHVYANGGTLRMRYFWFSDGEAVVSAFVFPGAPQGVADAAWRIVGSVQRSE